MTSELKIESNRRNAALSTGPKTEEGKNASSRNALKHGLTSVKHLLPDENREAVQELQKRLLAELAPVGVVEELLAVRIVQSMIKLDRASRIEAYLLADDAGEPAGVGYMFQLSEDYGRVSALARYERSAESSLFRTIHELRTLQRERRTALDTPPTATVPATSDESGMPAAVPASSAGELEEEAL